MLSGCVGSGSVFKAAFCATMCLAGSRPILTVTLPTCSCDGETSVIAGGIAGVAAALAPVRLDAVSAEVAGEGLAMGLALTPGALDGAGKDGFATHAVASRSAPARLPNRTSACFRGAALRRGNEDIT